MLLAVSVKVGLSRLQRVLRKLHATVISWPPSCTFESCILMSLGEASSPAAVFKNFHIHRFR
jgi:hypothetical protein